MTDGLDRKPSVTNCCMIVAVVVVVVVVAFAVVVGSQDTIIQVHRMKNTAFKDIMEADERFLKKDDTASSLWNTTWKVSQENTQNSTPTKQANFNSSVRCRNVVIQLGLVCEEGIGLCVLLAERGKLRRTPGLLCTLLQSQSINLCLLVYFQLNT